MNSQIETKPIDRRSALKKAAAVGAVAWTAPVLLGDSRASAGLDGSCTPKCLPTAFGALQFVFQRQCGTDNASPGDKWLRVTVNLLSGGGCPCGTTPTNHLAVSVGLFHDTNNSGDCAGGGDLINYTGSVTNPVLASNQFVIGKSNGAIGSGCVYGCVRVTSKCLDRDGNDVYRSCLYSVQITSTPSGGSCGETFTGVTVNASLQSCDVYCSPPPTGC